MFAVKYVINTAYNNIYSPNKIPCMQYKGYKRNQYKIKDSKSYILHKNTYT